MFVQVIKGRSSDPAALRAVLERWTSELAPGATGWLGTTAGFTDDGQFIALARFESVEAAQANSDRPEQGAWWADVEKVLDGEASFADSEWVIPDVVGDPDRAGFVQVMQGHGTDPDRARELMTPRPEHAQLWADYRPDILGSLAVAHPDGYWTMAIWFTSEDDARAGEQKPPPPEVAEQMEQMGEISDGEPVFYDLREPWMHSPA